MMASQSAGDLEQVGTMKSRVILQQCLSAKLMVQPATDTQDAQYVQVGRGLVVYICFMKGADEDTAEKMVKTVTGACLSESDSGKLVSILDLPGDILVIPQATMGGNLKGKRMQYHRNINKDNGLKLYTKFVNMCEEAMAKSEKCKEKSTVLKFGTYGNRQVFSMETNGPYSHIVEF